MKADARIGIGHAFRNPGHFRPPHHPIHDEQFYPIADGANGADKVVADSRAQQGGQVGSVCHGVSVARK